MKVLLDTCALLWLDQAPERLSPTARQCLQDAEELAFSSISAFEIAIKAARGQLLLGADATVWMIRVVRQHGLTEIPVDLAIAAAVLQVRLPHNDPCDRMVVASAVLHGYAVVTADGHIRGCPDVRVIW